MKEAKVLKWVTTGLELFFAIPVIGSVVIVSLYWIPLLVMLGLHITTLVFCVKQNVNKAGNIVGIVTSVVAIVPLLGWIMHLTTGILLLVESIVLSKKKEKTNTTLEL